jgi:hypothetical protein
MASALSALANATATFSVAGVGVVTDPETGNVNAAAASVTASFFLRVARVEGVISRLRGTDQFRYPGIDTTGLVYEGYAVDALDPRIVVGTTGTLTFAGESPIECEVTELRQPYGNSGLLGEVLTSALGERIQLLAVGQR